MRHTFLVIGSVLFVAISGRWTEVSARTGEASPEQLKRLSLEQLGQIVVTSVAKEPEQLRRTAAAIHVITQDEIRRSGATSLPDVLRLAPGVDVSQSDGNRWAVGIRGFGDIFSKNVLVLIDGRSVYTPLVGGVHWAIQEVLLADIEQIEVIRGPGGTLWGSNSVNGVINVITKAAVDSQGVRATVAAGSVEHVRAAMRYGNAVGRNLHYRVYATGFDRGAQFHADGTAFDTWRAGQVGFRADWARPAGSRLTVSGDVYKTRVGERAQVSFYTPPAVRDVDGRLDLAGANVILRWERQSAAGKHIRFQTYYDHTNRAGFTFGEVRDTADMDFNMRLAPAKRHAVAWGVGARVSPARVAQLVPTLNFAPNRRTNSLASGFIHDDITLIPERLIVSVGSKLEHNNYTGVEVLPSGRVLWMPARGRTFWGAITRSVRTPSRFERDLEFRVLLDPSVPLYLGIVGSPSFASETMLGMDVGYRQLVTPTLYLDAAVFHNRHRRLAGLAEPVVSGPTAPIPHALLTFAFANAVSATSRGFEIAPDWRPAAAWQLRGSYSYLHIAAENLPGFTNTTFRDNYVGQSARHEIRVTSRLDIRERVELDQTYRYVSALPAQHVPAYHTVDARLGYRLSNRVDVSFAGRNLLQPHHPEFAAVPVAIKRSAYLQVTWSR